MTNEPWVSIDAIARHLDVSKDTIYRWIDQRGMPAHKVGRQWKFKISEVDAWVRTGMRRGDPVLFYHSQKGLEVVGLLEVAKEAFPDPTAADPKWLTATFAPVRTLPNPVPLAEIRSNPDLAGIGLITQPRLAVIQLSEHEFSSIIEMGCLGCQSKDRDVE